MAGMKDSGVEWIGNIPQGWGVSKVKYLFENHDSKRIPVEKSEREQAANEGYPYYGANGVQDYVNGYIFDFDAILVGEDGSVIHDDGTPFVAVARNRYWVNNHAHVLSPRHSLNFDYATFALTAADISDAVNGSTRQKLTQGDLGVVLLPTPPKDEQQAITVFLDEKCAAIDAATETLEAQISTRERYRASVIHEAVTRGLDPAAPTKPSGVDWIGNIPQGWELTPLGYLGSFQNGISKDGSSFGAGYPFVSYGDAYSNRVLPRNPSGLVRSTSEERYRYSVRYGDVLFTRTSETVDEIAYASTCLETIENATFAGFLIRFRPSNAELDPRFGSYYFRSSHLRRYFSREMVIVTRASLGQQLLKRLPVLLPPHEEQVAIADYLDARTAAIDAVIATKRAQLDVLKRRRQSLIYEYVTGKRRVAQEG